MMRPELIAVEYEPVVPTVNASQTGSFIGKMRRKFLMSGNTSPVASAIDEVMVGVKDDPDFGMPAGERLTVMALIQHVCRDFGAGKYTVARLANRCLSSPSVKATRPAPVSQHDQVPSNADNTHRVREAPGPLIAPAARPPARRGRRSTSVHVTPASDKACASRVNATTSMRTREFQPASLFDTSARERAQLSNLRASTDARFRCPPTRVRTFDDDSPRLSGNRRRER